MYWKDRLISDHANKSNSRQSPKTTEEPAPRICSIVSWVRFFTTMEKIRTKCGKRNCILIDRGDVSAFGSRGCDQNEKNDFCGDPANALPRNALEIYRNMLDNGEIAAYSE